MPELLCGFTRRPGSDPTLYPVACAPQSWAAGAAYMLLAASLGLTIDAPERRVRFAYSRMPPFLDRVWIENLRVGEAIVDLALRRRGEDVGLNVTRRQGVVEVVIVK
jgi:glycogen debranching enzyme